MQREDIVLALLLFWQGQLPLPLSGLGTSAAEQEDLPQWSLRL
jgi:hypothetical protein